MEKIIGRETEKELLSEVLNSGSSELIAVYGRRRVGKTFLIRNAYEKQMSFEFSGIHNALLNQQLENFSDALSKVAGLPLAKPTSWIQAFKMLEDYLSPKIKNHRRVIFFDEFPWINTPKSGFLPAFENFWNMWASRQKNLVVVICGSAAAWMIQKVINNRGGLHNRVTKKIRLMPFTIGETKEFLNYRKINLDEYQILQLYMVMGGIPQYLKNIKTGESSIQAIDRLCFTKDGFLNEEFKNVFYSLFDNAEYHIKIIKALARKGIGLTRNEIIDNCKLSSGGGTTKLLEELSESGFITPYIPFGKSGKDTIYKLTDEYSHFYVKFIENSGLKGTGTWNRFSTGISWKSWSGNAFESVCMKHEEQIKKALGIGGVHCQTSMWRYKPDSNKEQGVQIDMLIDRQDLCINICEIKFSINEYEISKGYSKELETKLKVFRNSSKTRKTHFLTMITTHGVKNIKNYSGLIQNEIRMDELFK